MDLQGTISTVLSVVAAGSTFYFWLVKNSAERARLRSYLVVAPAEPAHLGWTRDVDQGPLYLAYLRLAVANYSALPNALLACRFTVKGKDGSWLPLQLRPRWNNLASFELPLNLPAMQTVPLDTWLQLKPGAGAEEGNGFLRYVASPVQFRIELTCLGEKQFTDVLSATK